VAGIVVVGLAVVVDTISVVVDISAVVVGSGRLTLVVTGAAMGSAVFVQPAAAKATTATMAGAASRIMTALSQKLIG
jgi:hypothetical protein